MANRSGVLDKWRDYFRSANSDIFTIIEHAIMVAASDCPYDFRLNRDRIAEMLFTCKLTKCFGCDQVKLSLPHINGPEKSGDKCKSGIEAGWSKDTKESKVNGIRDDDDNREMNVIQVSNCSYGDAEALTNEIEEESQLIEELLRIKEIFDNHEEESDVLLFDSLRRLQLTTLSVEILKATEIGKSVNALRKHRSKDIRSLAKTLIEDWTVMVNEWVDATEAIAATEVATESVKTSVIEEEAGLPSPPLDEGAFFATPSSMELSQFFDGMDDDGNPRNSGEFNRNRENGRRPRLDRQYDSSTPSKDRIAECPGSQDVALIKQAPPCKPNGLHSGESGPCRKKPTTQPKVNNETKVQHKSDKGTIQKKPKPPQHEKLSCNNEASVRMKLEAAKRKLQERYQEAENAKRQRTIQVMELHELPKQNLAQRNQNVKPGNHNRHWATGKR